MCKVLQSLTVSAKWGFAVSIMHRVYVVLKVEQMLVNCGWYTRISRMKYLRQSLALSSLQAFQIMSVLNVPYAISVLSVASNLGEALQREASLQSHQNAEIGNMQKVWIIEDSNTDLQYLVKDPSRADYAQRGPEDEDAGEIPHEFSEVRDPLLGIWHTYFASIDPFILRSL